MGLRARLWLLAAFVLAAAPAAAVEEWAVDGGTEGLFVEDHRVPLVVVRIEFAAGRWSPWVDARDADAAFEIQLHDSRGELRKRADLLAANVFVSAGRRASTLGVSCRKDDLPDALDLVRAILANRDFDRAELKRRRKGADLSWRASRKDPRFVLERAAVRNLFPPEDPRRLEYEKPRLPGTDPEKLREARDALVRIPGRIVGFAGDLTLEEAKRLADGLLPPVSPGAPPDLDPNLGPALPTGSRPSEGVSRLPRLTQVFFLYGRDSLGWLDPDAPASAIADHALGGHFNSRLMVALRQEGGDTYGARVADHGERDPGAYGLVSFTKTDNAGAMERKLRNVLRKFHEGGITEDERAIAAGNVLGRRAFRRQSPGDVLATAMVEKRYGLPYGFFDARAEKAASLSLDEVNAFIRKFHDPGSFTMLTVRPE